MRRALSLDGLAPDAAGATADAPLTPKDFAAWRRQFRIDNAERVAVQSSRCPIRQLFGLREACIYHADHAGPHAFAVPMSYHAPSVTNAPGPVDSPGSYAVVETRLTALDATVANVAKHIQQQIDDMLSTSGVSIGSGPAHATTRVGWLRS